MAVSSDRLSLFLLAGLVNTVSPFPDLDEKTLNSNPPLREVTPRSGGGVGPSFCKGCLMVRGLFVFCLLAAVLVDQASAQLFRRARACPDGTCAPALAVAPATVVPVVPAPAPVEKVEAQAVVSAWFQKLNIPRGASMSKEEEAAIRSWAKRAVRIINGNSCGTGSLCGRDSESIYILTNAHVASSRIGNVVKCEALKADGSGTEVFQARVIESAYSSKTSTDWALLRAPAAYMAGLEPIKLATEDPDADALTGTWGCPRCEVPSGQMIKTKALGSLWYWQPNSIGGQSGSAVVQDGKQFGLLTWTINGDGAGQKTATIYRQSREQNVDGAPREPGLVPVTPSGVELLEGFYSETGIRDYPIWSDVGPTPGPGPGTPCPEMQPEERRLFDALRGLREKERALDWIKLISLIMEIIKVIQEGKGS